MSRILQVAFIKARWHADIVDKALDGYRAEMARADIRHDVPGAFEMPLLAKTLGASGRHDAIIAAALVVDGGIYRHDFVAQAVVSGLMQAQLETGVPTFSVSLTPHHFHDSPEHRAFFLDHFVRKGAEAARAVAQIAALGIYRRA